MKSNVARIYAIDSKTCLNVFIFIPNPYRDEHKLKAYHKRRRVWAVSGFGRKTAAGHKRTWQIERWCKLIGAKMEEKVLQE